MAEEQFPSVVDDAIARGCIDHMNLGDLAGIVNVNDDNLPAPENMPNNQGGDIIYQDWGHSGICY